MLQSKLLLWTVSMGFFMLTLDATIVNVALPEIARGFGVSPFRVESIVVVYALTVAIVVPVSGWLAERFGTRLMYTLACLLFAGGSLLCTSTHELNLLLVGRGLQGVGGGLLLSVGRLIILQTFEGEQRIDALSFSAIPGLTGPVLGPVVGAWIVSRASWHWIFLVNVPIGIAGAAATYLVLPRKPVFSEKRTFDTAGYVSVAIAMVSISYSVKMLNALRHPEIAGAAGALAIAGMAFYIWHARHAERPLFSLQLFHKREFAVGATACLVARTANGAVPYLIPLFLQVIQRRPILQAGFMMLPMALAGIASKPFIGPWLHKWGHRQVLSVNTVALGLAIGCLAIANAQTSAWACIVIFAVFGFFNSVQFTAMSTLALGKLQGGDAAAGSSFFSMVQMLSISLGVSVASLVFTLERGAHQGLERAFQASCLTIAILTALSTPVFFFLERSRTS